MKNIKTNSYKQSQQEISITQDWPSDGYYWHKSHYINRHTNELQQGSWNIIRIHNGKVYYFSGGNSKIQGKKTFTEDKFIPIATPQ